jgi:glycerol transport system ATP-binding protein
MNLLPCRVEGAEAVLPGDHRITLGRAYPALSGRIEIGVRPEWVQVTRGDGVPVTLRRVEDLGRRRIARVELGGVPLAATLPEGMPVPAEPRLALHRLHLYADGRLVEAEGPR